MAELPALSLWVRLCGSGWSGEEPRGSELARPPGGSGRSARPALKKQWPGWAPGLESDGAAGKCQSIPVGIRRRPTITMRWRWTMPKTRGAAPRTRTRRARRSPRMGIAQVCHPAGLGPSPRAGLATGRSPHAGQLRPAGRAGRGEREGAETGSRPSAAAGRSRGAVWLPAGPGWRGGAGQDAAPSALRP